ncbi:hypothetical protein CRYUN_Cryun22dG0083300 [Craigia yunnanensis]
MASPTVSFLLLIITTVLLPSSASSLSSLPSYVFPSNKPPRFLCKHSHPIKTNHQQYRYETRYFSQPLDHFSFSDLPRFRQRYLINTEHWVGPSGLGPIFLYCGNEGDIEWFAVNTGFVWEIAPRFGAMVLFPEHRYYGESMPYGSKEEANRNATTLSYLTTEQALADFAVLITDLKRNLSAEGCPVVLFGGSYGGMLAAWMRLKYPHVAIGALASSAPILQFEDIVPPETFYNIVSNSFKRESSSCFDTIKQSWNALTSEGLRKDGLQQLSKTFRLCRELKSVQDLANWLDSAFSYLAMVNYPYRSNFLMPLPGHPIREREKYIFSRNQELNRLEKKLEASREDFEKGRKALKDEKSNIELTLASLSKREETVLEREALLSKKKQELLVSQEKIANKESDEICKIIASHETMLRTRKFEFKAELEIMFKITKDEVEMKRLLNNIHLHATICMHA